MLAPSLYVPKTKGADGKNAAQIIAYNYVEMPKS
jgi:hypothetical protein